jgi:hypothetical protein
LAGTLLGATEKHHVAYGTSEQVVLGFRGPRNRALVLRQGATAGRDR